MVNIQKIKAYVGFALKSRQIIIGSDDILSSKRAKIIIVSENLGNSTYEKLINHSQKLNIDIIKLTDENFKQVILT